MVLLITLLSLQVEEGSVKQFPSYDDRNYYFQGTLGDEFVPGSSKGTKDQPNKDGLEEFVLKINSMLYPRDLVDGLNCMMSHLRGKGIQCPYPLTSRNGRQLEMCSESRLSKCETNDKEKEYCVRVLFFIRGDVLDKIDKVHITPGLVYETGKYVGSLDAALQVGCVYSSTLDIVYCTSSV